MVQDQGKGVIENIRVKSDVDMHILRNLNAKSVEKVYLSLAKLELNRRSSNFSESGSPGLVKKNTMKSSFSSSRIVE